MKKRVTARAKVAKAAGKAAMSSQIEELQSGEREHENPFLKLLTVSKKEKQETRSAVFTAKVARGANMSGGVSKSALRRRKRKSKSELAPKMTELLDSLEQEPETIQNTVNVTYIKSKRQAGANAPNAAKKTGHKKILQEEHRNFQQVLNNPQFRASPFNALKAAIQGNMNR